MNDDFAASGVFAYERFKHLGLPYGPYAYNPNKLIEVIDLLESSDRLYHPPML